MRKSPKHDFQREEIYRWQHKFLRVEQSPLKQRTLVKIANQVCQLYDCYPPIVIVHKHFKYAGVLYTSGRLDLDASYASAMILCHELAHHILNSYGYRREFHGKRFLGLFLQLLAICDVLPLCASIPSARSAGLRLRSPATCAPGRLRAFLER